MDPSSPLDRAVSRRAFLGGGLAIAGAIAVGAPGIDALGTETAAAATSTKATSTKLVPLVLSSDLYVSPQPQRMVFGYSTLGGRYASGPATKVRFQSPTGRVTPFTTAPLDRAGLPKGRGLYVANPTLDVAGAWHVEARAAGKKIPFAIQVNPTPTAPIAGTIASRAASPTTTNSLGVDPICTRQPMCPLHTVSLADAIGAGKPVAVLFATPARCQSLYCGPVLDHLLEVKGAYGDRVTFVHVEIYEAPTGTKLSPTVDAWHIDSEPWLFGVDAGGTIRARLDGAFGGNEMKALLDGLVA